MSRPRCGPCRPAGVCSPRMLRNSTDLPVPEPPTMPKTSSSSHLHVEAVVHELRPEAVDQPAHFQDRVDQMSISMNSTANSASARITRKMACTTATRGQPAELARGVAHLHAAIACRPCAISIANTGALTTPTQKVVRGDGLLTRVRYCVSGMSSRKRHSSAPPVRPMRSAMIGQQRQRDDAARARAARPAPRTDRRRWHTARRPPR